MEREIFAGLAVILTAFLFCGFFCGSGMNLGILNPEIEAKTVSRDLFVQPIKNLVKESPQMSFIFGNSVVEIAPPNTLTPQVLGTVLGGSDEEAVQRKEIVEYGVEPGDTLSQIATKYQISLETILWANDLTSKSTIKTGQKLIILPVSGVVYNIKKGDTLSQIAKTYKGDLSEIIAFNELSNEGDIFIGDILIIPEGKMPASAKSNSYVASQIPLGSSYFICPTATCYITQGLHWYNAIDFGAKCGDPIFAAAGGVIQRTRYGWNGGAGNYVTILHPNGVVTMYGHLQTILVSPGQEVSQGEIIALMGGKPGTPGAGLSTGCHVHFDVRGARNPFAK